jgi:hypothetical protein
MNNELNAQQCSPLVTGPCLSVLNKRSTRTQEPRTPALRLYDNEDIEGWLREEGIGCLDRYGIFQYGIPPEELDNTDVPHRYWGEEN